MKLKPSYLLPLLFCLTGCSEDSNIITRTYRVEFEGGVGALRSDPPAACIPSGKSSCDLLYSYNSLTAAPRPQITLKADPGFYFKGWSGECSGKDVCTIDLERSGPVIKAQFYSDSFKSFTTLLPGGDLMTLSVTMSEGNPDLLLQRISGSTGATLWAKILGSQEQDIPEGVTLLADLSLELKGQLGNAWHSDNFDLDCAHVDGHFAAILDSADGSIKEAACQPAAPGP